MGVRGVALAEGDKVISLAILKSFEASPAERAAYLKQRRAAEGEAAEEAEGDSESEGENGAEADGASVLEPERFEAMRAAEQVILTISENGYGKRSSSYEYRVAGRGGKGIAAMAVNDRNGSLVASFPVEENDEIMLVTDGGQLIRAPVAGIRIAGRATQGVIVFDVAEQERVVSVDRIPEAEGEEEGE
jgi:DNA gyrase subunit A